MQAIARLKRPNFLEVIDPVRAHTVKHRVELRVSQNYECHPEGEHVALSEAWTTNFLTAAT